MTTWDTRTAAAIALAVRRSRTAPPRHQEKHPMTPTHLAIITYTIGLALIAIGLTLTNPADTLAGAVLTATALHTYRKDTP